MQSLNTTPTSPRTSLSSATGREIGSATGRGREIGSARGSVKMVEGCPSIVLFPEESDLTDRNKDKSNACKILCICVYMCV